MSPAETSFRYPKHTWGLQNHRPVKIAYGRHRREPTRVFALHRNAQTDSSSHGDGSSTSEDEGLTQLLLSTQRRDRKNSRVSQRGCTKSQRPAAELLALPPFFSQVSIPPGLGSDHDTSSDQIESSIGEPPNRRILPQRPTKTSRYISLTLIRTRLKNPVNKTKSLAHLQRRKQTRNPNSPSDTIPYQIGDGFSKSERKLQYLTPKPRDPRRTPPKTMRYPCLDLRPGALPPVHFACSSLEFTCTPLGHGSNASGGPPSTSSGDIPVISARPATSEVCDEDPAAAALQRVIMEELASVSAPAREASVASEDGSDGEEGFSSWSSGSGSRGSSGFCVEDDDGSDASGWSGGCGGEDGFVDSWEVWRESVRGYG